jgi:hypothetical protein
MDFGEAQVLWLDEDRVEFPARSDTEDRHDILETISYVPPSHFWLLPF